MPSRPPADVSQVNEQDIEAKKKKKKYLEKYEIKINEYEGRLGNGGI